MHFFKVVLDAGKAQWKLDFTDNMKRLHHAISSITSHVSDNNDTFNLDKLFELLTSKMETPTLKNHIPEYIYRVLFIYTQSRITPCINDESEYFQNLAFNKFIFCDVFYIYDKCADEDRCNEIYSTLNKLIVNQRCLILASSKSLPNVIKVTMRFLAHPLQRLN